MSAEFEAFLARIYADDRARARFRADPRGESLRTGLSPDECEALQKIDWTGLELAARSFARKRQQKFRRWQRQATSWRLSRLLRAVFAWRS